MKTTRDWGLLAYRWALGLFPRDFGDRHRAEMEELFLHLRAERARTRSPSLPVFWLRAIRDTCTHALRERWRRRTPSADAPNLPSRIMSNFPTDLRFAARTLRQAPLFTLVAVITLALGLGANTTIFSVVNGVLLRPLPYPQPEAIVWVDEWQDSRSRAMSVAWPNFRDWREQSRSFVGLAAFGTGGTTVLGADRPVRASLGRVAEDFWKVFPVRPVAGRLTVPGDHVEDAPGVVVLREDFWMNELSGRDLDEIVLEIQGEHVQAIGVVPTSFDFPSGAQLWVPAWPGSDSRTAHNWRVVGRLADGVSLELADQDLDAITRAIMANEPEDPEFLADGALVVPLREQLAGSARRPLLLLLGAAGLVLLVACTNLASTLMARGESRSREMAIRASLGAGRGRLVRQLVTESLVLSLLGGLAGLVLSWGLLRALRGMAAGSVPRLQEISIDPVVLGFTAAAIGLTALIFGLLPAFRLSAVNVTPALKAGDRGDSGGGSRRMWRMLVGSEVALAFVLLAGSGLLIRSFAELLSVERGFRSEGVVTAVTDLSLAKYEEGEDHARFYAEFETALEAQPEIARAGVVSSIPLSGFLPNGRLELDGDMSKHTVAGYAIASSGFFDVLGIRLVRGRLFDGRDGPDGAHAVIVSQSFADEVWPGEDPIGKQVTGGGMDEFWEERPFATVVGVVSDLRFQSLARDPGPIAYFPASQRPGRLRFQAYVVVWGERNDAAGATAALRRTLVSIDPDVPPRFETMDSRVRGSLAERRFLLYLLGGFASVALILASVGIYGVVSYSVARRTREIGIRLALGADPAGVSRGIQANAMGTVLVGVIVGVAAALASSRVLSSLLYEVSPTDPATLAGGVVVLLGAAWVAAVVPALRSTRIDPSNAMRAD